MLMCRELALLMWIMRRWSETWNAVRPSKDYGACMRSNPRCHCAKFSAAGIPDLSLLTLKDASVETEGLGGKGGLSHSGDHAERGVRMKIWLPIHDVEAAA
jgi:hypothetical protein